MKKLDFYWVDVFAERELEGNQLAVFPDGSALSDEEMQKIANEMNLSETTFINGSDPESREAYRVRIFTKEEELPFAGHPSLGTAAVLRSLLGREEIQLSLGVGIIPVRFNSENGKIYGEMTQATPEFGMIHEPEKVASALGLSTSDLDTSIPIETVSTGNRFVIVPLKNLEILKNLRPDVARMENYLRSTDGKFFYLVSRETVEKDSTLHTRMIYYGGEDPATGSAAGPACAWLLKHGLMQSGETGCIEQGLEIKRRSKIYISGVMDADRPINIHVGGFFKILGKGEISIG